jgi:hypothetical protein
MNENQTYLLTADLQRMSPQEIARARCEAFDRGRSDAEEAHDVACTYCEEHPSAVFYIENIVEEFCAHYFVPLQDRQYWDNVTLRQLQGDPRIKGYVAGWKTEIIRQRQQHSRAWLVRHGLNSGSA